MLLIIGLFLFVRSPWGQGIILQKAVSFLSKKTQTEIRVEKLFFTFRGDLFVKGLYVEDQKGDTLLYSHTLETGISLRSLIKGDGLEVSKVEWDGLKARVRRDSIEGAFNFDFFLNAFTGNKDSSTQVPESATIFPNIKLGPVDLSDFDLIYDDQVLGIRALAAWQSISLKLNSLDPNAMNFDVGNLSIKNSRIDYFQYKPFEPSEKEEASDQKLPLLVLDLLKVEGTDWVYQSLPDGILAKIQWKDLNLSLPEADLEAQKISLKYISLVDADIQVEITSADEVLTQGDGQISPPEITLPDWWIEVGNIDLEINRIAFFADGQRPKVGVFNPEALDLEDFNFSAHALSLYDQRARLVLDQVNFKEKSGLVLERLEGILELEEKSLNIKNLLAKTPQTFLDTNLELTFSGLNEFFQNPELSNFDLDIKSFQTNASEALFFQPELRNEVYFKELMRNGISMNGRAIGSVNRFQIPKFHVRYGKHSRLDLEQSTFSEVLELDRFQFDISQFRFVSKKEDVLPFMEDIVLRFPDDFAIDLKTKGSAKSFVADWKLNTSDGDIYSNINFSDKGVYEVFTELTINQLDLGKILAVEGLQPLSMYTSFAGRGSGLYDLVADLDMSFGQLNWKDLNFTGLKVGLSAKDTLLDLRMEMENDFLDFLLEANASLDSLNPALGFSLDLKNMKSLAMGLTKQDIQTKMKVLGKVDGTLDDLRATLELKDAVMIFQRKSYPLGEFFIKGRLADFLTEFSIQSDFLWGDFSVNASVENFIASVQDYMDFHLKNEYVERQEIKNNIKAKGKLSFHPTPFIDQLLVLGIKEMDTLSLDFNFNALSRTLNASLSLPMAQYGQAQLDGFSIQLGADAEKIGFYGGFKGIVLDPLNMGETWISGKYNQSCLNLDFFSRDAEGVIMDVKSILVIDGDALIYNIFPEGLIFNRESWDIPSSNQVIYAPKYLAFEDFSFSRNEQSITFSNQILGIDQQHAAVKMRDFELNTFFKFLNPEESLLTGKANGEIIVINPFESLGLVADLRIEGIQTKDIPLGNLFLKARAETLQKYNFLLAIKEGLVDLDLGGHLYADSVSTILEMNLAINAIQMELLDKLSDGEIREGRGFISGNIDLKGTIQDPVYSGKLVFNDASLLVSQINNRFLMAKESIAIDNSGLTFAKFTIQDEELHEFLIDGKILTPTFSEIGFDLKLNTKNFSVLNSTRKDNDLFFGKANVDLDMTVKGTLELPELDLRLKVNRGTNVTFIVPESQLALIERTGVVIFVNPQDPYDLLNKREMDLTTRGLTGYDVRANLQIDPQTIFNLIVDERTNDNLRLQGEADLNLLMNPNGDVSLSGRYEVNSGHYELNLFGLVNRRFELAEGSYVSWNGDPLDANLNLIAIYNVRTSAAQLMQAQLSGIDTDIRGQFRQVLPFRVYLKVGGEIISPEISFELDMPEQDRGAFGGAVYSMLQQVNEKDDELTKQVFSLLVLNQFFPMTGSDGSAGGSVNLARSSVSQVLSSQMNALSDRLFGDSGFSLDLDLDAFTDYQAGDAQDRTQLSVAARQSLMDDRLVISVGGQVDVEGGNRDVNQGDALFGDVSVEYLLNERGQWRAKAYRRNQFESVIDGQLVVTGVSLIFNKEFNAFRELFIPLRRLQAVPQREELEEAINLEEGD